MTHTWHEPWVQMGPWRAVMCFSVLPCHSLSRLSCVAPSASHQYPHRVQFHSRCRHCWFLSQCFLVPPSFTLCLGCHPAPQSCHQSPLLALALPASPAPPCLLSRRSARHPHLLNCGKYAPVVLCVNASQRQAWIDLTGSYQRGTLHQKNRKSGCEKDLIHTVHLWGAIASDP